MDGTTWITKGPRGPGVWAMRKDHHSWLSLKSRWANLRFRGSRVVTKILAIAVLAAATGYLLKALAELIHG